MPHYIIGGGTRGIGRRIVQKLLEQSHQVTVLARSRSDLPEDPKIRFLECDFGQPTLPEMELPDTVAGVAYCPGSITLRSFRALTPDDYLRDFQLNVLGAINLVKAILPALKKGSAGGTPSTVLFFSTIAVARGLPMHASVATCKASLEGLARTLAAELAPTIRVNCVAPALTQTDLTERFFDTDEKRAAMSAKYPLQRTGTVEDIATAATFLLSPASGWVTGQVLHVDGGMSTLGSV